MKRLMLAAMTLSLGSLGTTNAAVPDKVTPEVAKEKGCISCHEGIEDIRAQDSGMMAAIKALAAPLW